jgi:RNA recognition motif-containing protein
VPADARSSFAQVILEAETRRSRGYGFVTFCHMEHAQMAIGEEEGRLLL